MQLEKVVTLKEQHFILSMLPVPRGILRDLETNPLVSSIFLIRFYGILYITEIESVHWHTCISNDPSSFILTSPITRLLTHF